MKRHVCTALLLFALTGCASTDGTARLNVRGGPDDANYTTTFDRAYFAESGGATDLILRTGDADGAGPAVRQVVHLRVLWQPTKTIRVDSPSAANAMIEWSVVADDRDRLTYAGNCWANVSVDGNTATVDLRDAEVSVRKVVGQVNDPLRHARLAGRFTAVRSDVSVRASLDELAALDATGPAAAAATVPVEPQASLR